MKIVLQRVKEARVDVEGKTVGRIGRGLCLLVGVERGDGEAEAEFLARKTVELRVFPDAEGRMNLSLAEVGGEALAVSQFTLAASVRKGRRPSFDGAEEPGRAAELFQYFVGAVEALGVNVETGVFQAMMDVHILNDGPVTFILESRKGPVRTAVPHPLGGGEGPENHPPIPRPRPLSLPRESLEWPGKGPAPGAPPFAG